MGCIRVCLRRRSSSKGRRGDRRWMYVYIDGTFFHVRRTTVDREPTLVVLGVHESGRKSVLAMMQRDKDSRTAWESAFDNRKSRGRDPKAVKLGVMDGLPGLSARFAKRLRTRKLHVVGCTRRATFSRACRVATKRNSKHRGTAWLTRRARTLRAKRTQC